jgi:hypothetical protein
LIDPRIDALLRQQPISASAIVDLPEPGLADDGQRLAGVEVELAAR